MADLVNLNRARKARAKVERERQAAANRARFGRSKVETLRDRLEAERAAKAVDEVKRES
jgi:hypothetical protein